MKESRITILIVEDHFVVRLGLTSLINSEPDMCVIAAAEDGAEALLAFRKHQPAVVLLDLRLPDQSGVSVAAEIRKISPEARIIVLTTFGGDENVYRAFQAGAQAYLLKDVPKAEFLAAIRGVYRGNYAIPPEIAAHLAHRVSQPELSRRELEVLRLIVKGQSNKEIASNLSVTESTVKQHVNVLLQKLQVHDRTQAATSAIRSGLVSLE